MTAQLLREGKSTYREAKGIQEYIFVVLLNKKSFQATKYLVMVKYQTVTL